MRGRSPKSKPAYDFCVQNSFEPVISSITIERVNRAGDKIKQDYPEVENLDIGYKVYTLTDKPEVIFNEETKQLEFPKKRDTHLDTLINMLVSTCKPLHTKIEEIKKEALYSADNEIYVIGTVKPEELASYNDIKINIDAYADFKLEDYLNLDIANKENISVIF